jgi:ubiquinone/menaquinone biosynthesis C-methylase UbiE
MDASLQRRVQRYGWDKAAPYYERSWQAQLEPAQTALLELATLGPRDCILDVACGTGLVTVRAAAVVDAGREVVGTDISEHMIAAARIAARDRGATNTRFERMDAEDLKFPEGSFDAVLCALGLMYVPEPERAVREFHRVLRPAGRAVAAVWGQRNRCGWAEIFPIVEARVQSDVCPMFFRLGASDGLQQAFAAAGFTNISARRLRTRLHYASAEEACVAAFAGGPVGLAYSRFSDDVKQQVHKEYLVSLESYRQGQSYAVPAEFVVVAGIKGAPSKTNSVESNPSPRSMEN